MAASIFPDPTAGGVVYRTQAGAPTNPANVDNIYAPAVSFVGSCAFTALPSDCTARFEPRQLNALISELLALAEYMDPNGPWNCSSLTNLKAAFQTWVAAHPPSVLNDGDKGDIVVSGGGTVWNIDTNAVVTTKINNDAVTNAKLANMANLTIKGCITAGDPIDEPVGVGLAMDATSLRTKQSMSIVADATNGLTLVGDVGAPGASKVYGTNAGGTRGWYAAGAGVVGLIAHNIYPASQTITIPTGATRALIKMWGGSGGSGGATGGASGGTGGPGYLEKYLTGLTSGNTLVLTIGAAGTAGTSAPGAGGAGGNSTLASGTQTISTLQANGSPGTAGITAAPQGAGGAGGTATGGDLNLTGDAGGCGCATNLGGAAGPGVAGRNVYGAGVAGTAGGNAGNAGNPGGCIIDWYS